MTIFTNISNYLLENIAFFNFFLEIEQKMSRLIREDQPAFLNLVRASTQSYRCTLVMLMTINSTLRAPRRRRCCRSGPWG